MEIVNRFSSYNILFISTFVILIHVTKSNSCKTINVSISQTIDNPGFHKDINWLVEFASESNLSSGTFALHLKVFPEMFVNPDEIAELVRRKVLSARVVGAVNIETPKHLSEGHELFVYFNITTAKILTFNIPIHLRYQKASLHERFAKAVLEKPSLLYYPNLSDDQMVCGKKISAVCEHSEESCSWFNVSYDALFDESVLLVPIGNLEHYPLVAIATIALGCIGCLYILSVLLNDKVKQE